MMNRAKERWAVGLAGLIFVISVLWFGFLSRVRPEVSR